MKDIEITQELIDKWTKFLNLHEYNLKNKSNIIYCLQYSTETFINKNINHHIFPGFIYSVFRIHNDIYFNISQNTIRNKINQMIINLETQYNTFKHNIYSNKWFSDRIDIDAEFSFFLSNKHNYNIRLKKIEK